MKNTKGFTLIELLVVIAIIGILSSVVLASLSTARAKSRDARRISDVGQIQLALELYFDSSSSYPVTAYAAITTPLAPLAPTYLPKLPVDPQNTGNYVYKYYGSTTKYALTSTLERGDNSALLTDADILSATGYGYSGTSVGCSNTDGTAQGQASPTETCYDITN